MDWCVDIWNMLEDTHNHTTRPQQYHMKRWCKTQEIIQITSRIPSIIYHHINKTTSYNPLTKTLSLYPPPPHSTHKILIKQLTPPYPFDNHIYNQNLYPHRRTTRKPQTSKPIPIHTWQTHPRPIWRWRAIDFGIHKHNPHQGQTAMCVENSDLVLLSNCGP